MGAVSGEKMDLLAKYRRILDCIHAGGNIYYDKARMEAYKLIAILACRERDNISRYD